METLFKIYKLNNCTKCIDSFKVYKSTPDGITYYSMWALKNVAMANMMATSSLESDSGFFRTPEEVIQAYERECQTTLEQIKDNYTKKYVL